MNRCLLSSSFTCKWNKCHKANVRINWTNFVTYFFKSVLQAAGGISVYYHQIENKTSVLMDSVSNRKFVSICSCMWEYLHLTIPPRIKLLRIAAITMKLPRSSLFSYQIIWMTGFCFVLFFFLTSHTPLSEFCWNPHFI